MANIDYLRASDGTGNAAVATIQSVRSSGATTIAVDTVENFNTNFIATMGTPHTFVDPVTSETITVISEATAVDFKGHVDGGNLEIDAIAPGFTDAGSQADDIVIVKPTTQWADELADWAEVEHNQDGTHSDITAATIVVADGGTLDVDTINEATAANGVSIDGFAVKDGLVVGGAGTGVSNAGLDTTAGEPGGAWTSWTPSLTNLSGGTLNYAKYTQIGKTVICRFKYTLAGAGVAGAVSLTLPVNASSEYATSGELLFASVSLANAGAAFYDGSVLWASATTVILRYATGTTMNSISSTVPFTWGNTDFIQCHFSYEAA